MTRSEISSRTLLLCLFVSGCDAPAAAEPSEDGKPDVKSTALAPSNGDAAPEPNAKGSRKDERVPEICEAFDRDAVKALLGWTALSYTTGLRTGSDGHIFQTCAFKGGPKEGNFGLGFYTNTKFDARHDGFQASYEPHDAIDGLERRIARAEDRVVMLQTVTAGIRIVTSLSLRDMTAAQVEPKLVAATRAVIESMPKDPASMLRSE
ncbi:MAG: hypothetical protein H7138_07320 [Myxococcales bacterium]|nr:hypothetical protein [Myxococcales bacterium]